LTSGAGTYRLSAWVKYSSDLEIPPGKRTVFHARWYSASDAEIKSGTNLEFDEDLWPTAPDVYQHISMEFDTGDVDASRIEWYVGYPMFLTAGSIRLTGLQVEGPDGRRYIHNGNFLEGRGEYNNFIGGRNIEYYNEGKSYGETAIVEDCALPCIERRNFGIDPRNPLSSENWSAEVQNIPFIKDRGVGAVFYVIGSFQPGTFGSLNYYQFRVASGPSGEPNRVHFLDNILVYFDANGFITTPSPRNVIVTDDMVHTLPSPYSDYGISGVDFFAKYYGDPKNYTHLSLPGLRYDSGEGDTFEAIEVLDYLPGVLFNGEAKVSRFHDLTFGPDQPVRYSRCGACDA